jgi:aryl-alcohol dehydrogenase-like predicted oxidoreductase
MRDLNSVSRIGFGCYRVSINSATHRAALHRALDHGCNLIDTASNYMDGESESLVGVVAEERADCEPFIITKAGYVRREDEDFFRSGSGDAARQELVVLGEGTQHCIHPDFLKRQIARSAERLRRRPIDAFLLHNPEYAFRCARAPAPRAEFARRVERAFALLEQMVETGAIRFYGVSSNTLVAGADAPDAVELQLLIDIAGRVAQTNHFRLIQFPFNLAEWAAASAATAQPSLIERARRHGLVTVANRPLNAKVAGKLLRLADPHPPNVPPPEGEFAALLDRAVTVLNRQLASMGVQGDIADVPAIDALRRHAPSFDNPEMVDDFFLGAVHPVLRKIYPDGMPPADGRAVMDLQNCLRASAERAMSRAVHAFRERLVAEKRIRHDDQRPLQVTACEAVLAAGVDHVLVGMRHPDYVSAMSPLF